MENALGGASSVLQSCQAAPSESFSPGEPTVTAGRPSP